jgi:hypothetical protein
MDNTKLVSIIWKEIDLAAAATAKGSALAASDVIETVRVPANSVIVGGWAQKTAAFTGTVSVLTLSVGITGVNATGYANAWDGFAATVGSYSTPGAVTPVIVSTTGGDTVDILLASLTGTLTGGKILVAVLVADTSVDARGVIAQPKS